MYSQKERIAFFIDLDSLNGSRIRRLGLGRRDKINEATWADFNERFTQLGSKVLQNSTSNIIHMGTRMFVGRRYYVQSRENTFLEFIRKFDSLEGFIIQYGHKVDLDLGNNKTKLQDLGVDTLLACQMLIGAMEDKYDSCILFTDDQDFLSYEEISEAMGMQLGTVKSTIARANAKLKMSLQIYARRQYGIQNKRTRWIGKAAEA